MKRPYSYLFSLQQMVIQLVKIDRNHYIANTGKKESDVEHSFTVAMLCWFIHDRYKLDLDIGKIIKYSLVHDLVEIYAGDINTFAKATERQQKLKNEKRALDKISTEFYEFEDMVRLMKNYEEKSDEEALFVWTVDKMQPLVMGDLDNWRPYREIKISYAIFENKYSELLKYSSPYCKDIFNVLIEYCKTTYYDQSENKSLRST